MWKIMAVEISKDLDIYIYQDIYRFAVILDLLTIPVHPCHIFGLFILDTSQVAGQHGA